MIVKKILSCAAVMSALLFSDVCAAQDALSLVPADAGVVMRIEAGRILEKMGGEEFISKVVVSDDDTAEIAWKLFRRTGSLSYYMLYKQLKK